MRRIKRWTALMLAIAISMTSNPINAVAAESSMVSISVVGTIEGRFNVIEKGRDELMFSIEDLQLISGYDCEQSEEGIIFSRGVKTVRVVPEKACMYLLEGVGFTTERKMETKPIEVNETIYLPGSEVLPMLNVTVYKTEDSLAIVRDENTIWELAEEFNADLYKFDFNRACVNMGVDTDTVKTLSYVLNNGLDMVLDVIPTDIETFSHSYGEAGDYMDIYEDMLKSDDAIAEYFKESKDNYEVIEKYLDIKSDYGVPDGAETIASFLPIVGEVMEYAVVGANTNALIEEKLSMFYAINQNEKIFGHYSKGMGAPAGDVYGIYKDKDIAGAIIKLLLETPEILVDLTGQKAVGTIGEMLESNIVGEILDHVEFFDAVSNKELKDLDNVTRFDALAKSAKSALEYKHRALRDVPLRVKYNLADGTDYFRHHAEVYVASCEYSWRAMAAYAREKKSDYADNFDEIADACLKMRAKLFECALNAGNDNRGYDEGEDLRETVNIQLCFEELPRGEKADAESEELTPKPSTSSTINLNEKDGSNNLNMNYIIGDYKKVPATCMVSDGENIFMTMPTSLAFGVTGILRHPLVSAMNSTYDGTLVYEIPIPEDQLDPSLSFPEYGEPIAMGMYDKENLCVVMPTGERDYDFDKGTANDVIRFEKIPAFDVTYAGDGNVYDIFTMTECVERPKLVGEWFYFERDLESGIHGLFRRSIYSGKEEQITEHYVGYREETGLERLTYVLDEENLIAMRYNNAGAEAIVMNVRNGSVESVELGTECEVVGTYDEYVYFTGEPAKYKLPLYRMKKGVWEPELVLTDTNYGYRYNFYQNTMFLLSEDDVFVIPLNLKGKDYSDYEKIRIYTAISMELAPPFPDSGIWIWDGKIWTYSCLGELNSTLKVLGECEGIISQFTTQMEAQEIQTSAEKTEHLNDGSELNLKGIYSIGSMSDDASAIQFHPDTETVQIWNFDIFSFTEQRECYLSAGYRVVDGGIEISVPYGYEFYQVESTNDGITISKDGVLYFFEKAPTF